MQGPWAHALLKVVKRCAKPRFVRDGARIWSGSVNRLLNDPNPTARWETKLVSYTVHTYFRHVYEQVYFLSSYVDCAGDSLPGAGLLPWQPRKLQSRAGRAMSVMFLLYSSFMT